MKKIIGEALIVFLLLLMMFNSLMVVNARTIDESVPTFDDFTRYSYSDFSDNSLLVTINNSNSLTFKEYTVSDFSEIEAVEVSNILESSYDYEKRKYEALMVKEIDVADLERLPYDYNKLLGIEVDKMPDVVSYLEENNYINIITRQITNTTSKKRNLDSVVDEYISKLEEEKPFLKDTDYSKYKLWLKITIDYHSKAKVIEAIEKLADREDIQIAVPNYYATIDEVKIEYVKVNKTDDSVIYKFPDSLDLGNKMIENPEYLYLGSGKNSTAVTLKFLRTLKSTVTRVKRSGIHISAITCCLSPVSLRPAHF